MYSSNNSTNISLTTKLNTFIAYNIANYRFASPVDDIDQIINFSIHDYSGPYNFINGFINHVGNDIPVVDTYFLLCGEKSCHDSILVTNVNDMQIGFSIDSVEGMINVTKQNSIKDFSSIGNFTKLNILGITNQSDDTRILINIVDLLEDDKLAILLKIMEESKNEKEAIKTR